MPSDLWLVVMMTPVTLGIAYSARCFSSMRSTSGGAAMMLFSVVVEGEAVELAEVARLADAQDHRLEEPVEAAEHLLRRDLEEIPGTDRVLDRLEQRVLADALFAAEHQGVVDLVGRLLNAMRQPADDVAGIVAVELLDVVQPAIGVTGDRRDDRRAVEVEDLASQAAESSRRRRSGDC